MSYGANDIKTLSVGRAFREKLGMYLTSEKQGAIKTNMKFTQSLILFVKLL